MRDKGAFKMKFFFIAVSISLGFVSYSATSLDEKSLDEAIVRNAYKEYPLNGQVLCANNLTQSSDYNGQPYRKCAQKLSERCLVLSDVVHKTLESMEVPDMVFKGLLGTCPWEAPK